MRILPTASSELEITKDDINRLLIETHKKCATAAEEVLVLKELAKINGHYEKSVTNQYNVLHIEQKVEQLEKMSDAQLLELAGQHPDMLQLPVINADDAEYAEFTEVTSDAKSS